MTIVSPSPNVAVAVAVAAPVPVTWRSGAVATLLDDPPIDFTALGYLPG